jgi:hypothetical protein
VVQRIFAQFLTGAGIYATAETLTADGVRPRTTQPATRTGAAWPGLREHLILE